MPKKYRIELDDGDLGQLLDGLEIRAESWERTAEYLRTEKMPDGEFFLIEECGEPDEPIKSRNIIAPSSKKCVSKWRSNANESALRLLLIARLLQSGMYTTQLGKLRDAEKLLHKAIALGDVQEVQ